MKINFIKAPSVRGELIATTNNKGNLYLNVSVVNFLGINKDHYIQLGYDTEAKDRNCIYGIIHSQKTPDTFRFYRQGQSSMTVHIHSVLTECGLPFKTQNMKFRVSKIRDNDFDLVKFERIIK